MIFVRTFLPIFFVALTGLGVSLGQGISLVAEGEQGAASGSGASVPSPTPVTTPVGTVSPSGTNLPAGVVLEKGEAPMFETPPPRAIIVEEAPEPTPPAEVLANLPTTLPADAKMVYSQCRVPGQVIAITFDDGPNPETTPRLLNMLKERGIKATFFVVGRNVVAYPAIVKRIHAEGHELASHSWSHPLLTRLSQAKVDEQMKKTHDAIIAASGFTPVLYRPPYGAAKLNQKKSIHEMFGYSCILWDVDPNDWQHPRSAQKVYSRILAQTRPGSIILCHDIHKPTVDAMPKTLDDLTAKGYKFVTVTQLINLEIQHAPKPPVQVAELEKSETQGPPPAAAAPGDAPKDNNNGEEKKEAEVPTPSRSPVPETLELPDGPGQR